MKTTALRRRDLAVLEHTMPVPLDHGDPTGEQLELFAREVVAPDRQPDDLPYLLYLQGGPGGRATRPARLSGWLEWACQRYRVVLLDQRGTGRSSPVEGRGLIGDAAKVADYLAHFRADSIVADAELLRRALLGPDGRWSLLGQSYGGFCTLTYLSYAPEHLDRAFITGGLPALSGGPDPVYRACYPEVARHNADYFAQYPEDRQRCARIAAHLAETTELLPTGVRLTPRLFQTLGFGLGLERLGKALHYLIEDAFIRDGMLSDMFLRGVERAVSFAENPLFPVMHELIYCQGQSSRWSAQRIRAEFAEFDVFDGPEFLFTGEMTYLWQFDDDPALVPLKEAAHLLAERDDWPALYDPARLAGNQVPTAAAIYRNDMYVNVELSLGTADAIGNLHPWLCDDLEHDGLDLEPDRVLGTLTDLLGG